ncbi:MAG: histidine kinase [Candidatus Kapabacteria bacterium]|nr:histidine kinase [Candidatus Kapabacteria bacterium]
MIKLPPEIRRALDNRLQQASGENEKFLILSSAAWELQEYSHDAMANLAKLASHSQQGTTAGSDVLHGMFLLAATYALCSEYALAVETFYEGLHAVRKNSVPDEWLHHIHDSVSQHLSFERYTAIASSLKDAVKDNRTLNTPAAGICAILDASNGDYANAAEHLRTLVSPQHNHPDVSRPATYTTDLLHEICILCLINSGECDAAGILLDAPPHSTTGRMLRGLIDEHSGRTTTALLSYSSALEHEDTGVELRHRLLIKCANLASVAGNYTDALRYVQSALHQCDSESQPHNAIRRELHRLAASLHDAKGDVQQSVEHYRSYVQLTEHLHHARPAATPLRTRYDVEFALAGRERNRVQLAHLDVRSLRAHLHPQILYNSLMAIQYFMVSNSTERVHHYLSIFAAYMRQSLNNARHALVTLHDEIECLHRYLKLQELRLGTIFSCDMDLDTSLSTDLLYVPPMILQPFVEEALWQGMLPHNTNVTTNINVTIEAKGKKKLHICISDNSVRKNGERAVQEMPVYPDYPHGVEYIAKRIELLSLVSGMTMSVRQTPKKDGNTLTGMRVDIILPIDIQPGEIE